MVRPHIWAKNTMNEVNTLQSMSWKCKQCGLCCKYVLVRFKCSADSKIYYEAHPNFIVTKDGTVYVRSRCKHLLEDNTCDIYESRPDVCRKCGEDECEFTKEHLE